MKDKRGFALGIGAMLLYIVGGIGTFGGIAMIALLKGRDLWGWGDGRAIGYLFLCTGLGLSILGVLMMRILRNRHLV